MFAADVFHPFSQWKELLSNTNYGNKRLQRQIVPDKSPSVISIFPPKHHRMPVIRIQCGAKRGSGIVIDRCVVLTCAHVVKKSTICVIHAGDTPLSGKIIYHHDTIDVAVVLVEGLELSQLLKWTQDVKASDEAIMVGFPARSSLSSQQATTTSGSIALALPSQAALSVLFKTSCPVYSGMSGGAMLVNGNLAGMVTAYAQVCQAGVCLDRHDVSFALPAAMITPWLSIIVENVNADKARSWLDLRFQVDAIIAQCLVKSHAAAVHDQFPIASKL
eukprot:TRINITY_DN9544_c0_g3_i1.p1 TRINITY_DN9544_c0_g3~~TRINITY_DN9544_c0_g3_i1.p1  ORF type:complete len:275 (+),score=25.50 TRINITY_DN9544_c0_g3_i1:111-935(+)